MKKKLIFFLCSMCMLAVGVSSCGDKTPNFWTQTEIEEISKESARSVYYELMNPTFENVGDVAHYQEIIEDEKSIDSTFSSLPVSTLKRVADVCINKSGATDKKQIVNEYLKNISVYDNMSKEITPANSKDDKAATDSGGSDVTKKDGVFETSYNYYTDTVDGNAVRVQVKTEKSYVKE